MAIGEDIQVCKHCYTSGKGKYCNQCGQAYAIKRISLSLLIHDVVHFFTHFEKGFGYTLKQLIIAPGKMQKSYIEGNRAKHQKPFSMFFICATVAGLARYWIFLALLRFFHHGNISEANFFHEYMVLLQIALMPFNIFLTYILFYKSHYNYAEIGVMLLYNVSAFFLMVTLIALLRFIWPALDTAFIELPLLSIYNAITFVNFFSNEKKWIVILKSIVLMLFLFLITQFLEDWLIKILS